MNTILCVLKSGVFKPWTQKDYTVEYGPRHVQWLRDQCAAQITEQHRFVCLTDMEIPGVETLPLQHNLPGWWSKLEIFSAARKAVYLDLDTVVVGNVAPYLFHEHQFTMSAHMTRKYGYNSSVMSWDGDYEVLITRFLADKARFMAEYTTHDKWGDQDFIRDQMRGIGPITTFQDRSPGMIISYKRDIRDYNLLRGSKRRLRVRLRGEWWRVPRVICFHGAPKPEAVQDQYPWIPRICPA